MKLPATSCSTFTFVDSIGHDPGQHAAYVESWVKALEEDPMEIFRAAADAEKIQKYVLGLEQQQVQAQTSQPEAGQAIMEGMMMTNQTEQGREGHTLAALASGEIDQNSQTERVYLAVPFPQKDEVKALGAKWDRQAQSWYVPAGVDAAPFAKWAQQDAETAAVGKAAEQAARVAEAGTVTTEGRRYLAVPYGERIPAKAAGAEWDKVAKSWYAGTKADLDKLQRWLPENVPGQQAPAMNPHEEFGEALRSLGCVVAGEHPIMDGQRHRIATEGDKKGELAGFYVGHLDGHPAGYIKNNRTGLDITWKSKGYALDPEQKAALAAEAAEKLQARAAEQQRLHEQAAQRVVQQSAELLPVEQPTPYMVAKGIAPLAGALTDREGKTTYLPATDAEGKQWSTQYIQEDGTKRFAKDSRKEGCFHAIGGLEALAAAPALVIAEGYATAATLNKALGFSTVAAFDAGNLPAVAQALHAKFPDKPIVIAGDDDREVEAKQGINPGRTKAEEAAQSVGGVKFLPIFAPAEQAADPKGLTDFNDLATKSVLGAEGVARQARAVVDKAIAQHQQQRLQHDHAQHDQQGKRLEDSPKRSAHV